METAINKATDYVDSFPKDKHVRKIICGCTSHYIASNVYRQLLEKIRRGNPVTQIKAIQVIHRIMLDGPDQACTDASFNPRWAQQLEDFKQRQEINISTDIFVKYVRMIDSKVKLHTQHPFIPGSMDSDLFKRTSKRVNLDKFETIQSISKSFLSHANICKTSSDGILKILRVKKILSLMALLVTLVRELSGIYYMHYHIIFSTFVKLHNDERYRNIIKSFDELHDTLKVLFDQISVIREVTSLISVPELSADPPDFSVIVMGVKEEPLPSPPKEPTPEIPVKTQPVFEEFDFDKFNETPRTLQKQAPQPTFQPFDFASIQEEPKPKPIAVEKEKEVIVKIEKVVDTDQINRLIKRIKELETDINEKGGNEKVLELQKIINELQQELNDAKQKNEQLELLQQEMIEKDEMIAKLKEIELESVNKQHNIDELQKKLVEMQNEIRELENKKKEEEILSQQYKEKLDEAQAVINTLNNKIEEYNTTTQNKDEKSKELNAELERLKQEIQIRKEMQNQIEEFKKNNEEMQNQLQNIQQQKDEEINQMKELQKKCIDLEKELEIEKVNRANDYWEVVAAIAKGVHRDFNDEFKIFNDQTITGNSGASKEDILKDLATLKTSANVYAEALKKNTPKEAEKELQQFSPLFKQLFMDIKGVEMKMNDDQLKTQIRAATEELVEGIVQLMEKTNDREHVDDAYNVVDVRLVKEKSLVESIEETAEAINLSGIDDDAERELLKAAQSINGLAEGVSAEMDINQAIMESAQAIAKATAALVTAAAQAQKERTIIGKKLATPTKPYAPNLIWSEGLVTAGKAVAEATKQIVSVANNNVTPGAEKNEDALIATSHEVAKATAQLVTATRSKADFDSPTLGKVENASNGVMQSTKLLVEAVKAITNMKKEKEGVVDYSKLSDYQLIIKERETQILVLKLRRELEAAESKLKTLNKQKYDRQNN
ncbi:Caldesmon [Entamoeba marina]